MSKPNSPVEQIAWIWGHWRDHRAYLPWIVVLTFLSAAVMVATPVFLQRIIDGIGASADYAYLARNVAWLLGLGLLQAAGYLALMGLRMRCNISLDYGVRMRAFERLTGMGPSFFNRFRTGDIVTRLTDDVTEKLAWYMCSGIFRTFEAAVVILFGVIMMVRINPELTVYAAGPLPILVGIFVLTANRLEARYQAVQASISAVNDSLESAFSGIRVIKGFATEPLQIRLVGEAVERQRAAEVNAVRYQSVIDTMWGHIWQLAIVGILLFGGAMAMEGSLSLGELVAFDAYVLLLVFPMFDLGQFLVRGRVSAVNISRITEMEDAPTEIPEWEVPLGPWRPHGPAVTDGPAPPAIEGGLAVELREVWYRYPGSEADALREVTFDALPGTITALAGPLGSGKSSVLRLLPRLSDPAAGRIRIGGRALADWDPAALRRAVGTVPQEALLFSTTVRENIRFGRAWVSEEDVAMAVEAAGLAGEIASWPAGMETQVGARGMRLSGGQKQRVALARALAGRPAVLVLDDSTASLDAETEDRVWCALHRELPGCTTIAVTHRPATLERAARVVVLENGAVVEQGTFAELHRPGTAFHRLYHRWKLESDLE